MQQWLLRVQRQRQTIGLVALALVWLPAFQVWWVAPQRARLEQRSTALAAAQAEVGRLRELAARLPALDASPADAVDTGMAGYPYLATGDGTLLLRRVELLARESAVALLGFAPQPPLTLETHAEWPARLELQGAYPDLLRLFIGLAGCDGGLAVGDFTIGAAPLPDTPETAAVRAEVTVAALAWPASGAAAPRRIEAASCTVPDAAEAAGIRADPFAATPDAAPHPPLERPAGLAGWRVAELTLQGLVETAGRPLAVVAAPDGQIYMLRGGERLLDGAVAAVQPEAVVFQDAAAGVVRRALADGEAGR